MSEQTTKRDNLSTELEELVATSDTGEIGRASCRERV